MKKIFLSFVVLTLVFSVMSMSVIVTANVRNNVGASPNFKVIIECCNSLTLGNWGKLTCLGETDTDRGYIAEAHLELQVKDGNSWTTFKEWEGSGDYHISVERDWYVESGHSYRLKVTHTAYSSERIFIEDSVTYSNIINY